MKSTILIFCLFTAIGISQSGKLRAQQAGPNMQLKEVLDNYYEEAVPLRPIAATMRGDNRFNDQFPNTISAPYLAKMHDYYIKYRNLLGKFQKKALTLPDQLSLAIANFQIDQALAAESLHLEYMPFDQGNSSLPASIPAFGSGTGIQPFKTVKDYDNWLKRITAFSDWADTAIANFNKGIAYGMVLPKALVIKMIPQMETLTNPDTSKNPFYKPVLMMPDSFSAEDKAAIRSKYFDALNNVFIPAYAKLAHYLKNEYLPKARNTSGYNSLPNGPALYQSRISFYTTTDQTPEQILQTGLTEVKRITNEIDALKTSAGFTGSTLDLFNYIKTDKRFFPFQTEQQVLDSFTAILPLIAPNLKKMFNTVPRSAFKVKAIEKFRAASSASNYQVGSEDGTRPGFFNARIISAPAFNASGMQSLFSHEAIPGHHFQLSLQMENASLPRFRKFSGNSAFSEGWALYAESLGDELGLYKNPFEKISALGSELFRAARLVVDVSIHTGKMNREEAIKYMTDVAGLNEVEAISEVERYMAQPGQALAYKTGELKIKELRARYEKQLGKRFSLKNFHDAILLGGAMPLGVFEWNMDEWARQQ